MNSSPESLDEVINFRLTKSQRAKIAAAVALEQEKNPVSRVKESDIVRLAVAQYLDRVEAGEQGLREIVSTEREKSRHNAKLAASGKGGAKKREKTGT